MNYNFESTGLWLRTLGENSGAGNDAAKEKLRAAYRQFWSNAVALSSQIQKDVPGLTLHDEAHFEALWQRADQIAGQSFELTPLEVFVLGGAILLHDSANSIAAFDGGLSELQSTPEWTDAAAEWKQNNELAAEDALPTKAHGQVLFETLRALHAVRAESIASLEVSVGGSKFRLIGDDQLRTHLGGLIGLIAASHHWDVSELQDRLGAERGALPAAGMPSTWTIRPVLVASLLRCADASQLDQQRAPDFLYGLLKLRGISELHWRAQNRLAAPYVDQEDPQSLVFTSTKPFCEDDAEAWWIAYDAIKVANRELQTCNSLLKDLRLPSFELNRVRGAESPERLSKYVMASGWRPVSAEVRASRIDRLVDMFGGSKLYGKDRKVPLRELIQNAADAIRLRRALELPEDGYEGKIVVRIRKIADSADVWLYVDDDGLGMSEAVLTGPLIDFGSSYVSSSLVKLERPGLLALGTRRIGKFGIGFFSTFMISSDVYVVSRPYDKGLDSCRTLRFKETQLTRPILLESRPPDFGATLSSRVALRIGPDVMSEMLTLSRPQDAKKQVVDLAQLVGFLCPMLDVDVFVAIDEKSIKIHSRQWMEEDRTAWLNRIMLPDLTPSSGLPATIEKYSKRLTYIDPLDPSAGLACISAISVGVATVGTLRSTGSFNLFRDGYVGAIDHIPDGPRRERGSIRARSKVAAWATDQAARIAGEDGVTLRELHSASMRIANFGGDATAAATVKLNKKFAPLQYLFDLLRSGENVYCPITAAFNEKGSVITEVRQNHSGWIDNYNRDELEYVVNTLEGEGNSGDSVTYYLLPTTEQPAKQGLLMILMRFAESRGYRVSFELLKSFEFAKYVGEDSPRQKLFVGKMISSSALVISASAIAGDSK